MYASNAIDPRESDHALIEVLLSKARRLHSLQTNRASSPHCTGKTLDSLHTVLHSETKQLSRRTPCTQSTGQNRNTWEQGIYPVYEAGG